MTCLSRSVHPSDRLPDSLPVDSLAVWNPSAEGGGTVTTAVTGRLEPAGQRAGTKRPAGFTVYPPGVRRRANPVPRQNGRMTDVVAASRTLWHRTALDCVPVTGGLSLAPDLLVCDDRTGISDPQENWTGLHDARAHLV